MHPLFLSLFFVAISRALARAHGSETVFGAEGDENINVYCSVCRYDPLKNGIHHARYTMFEVYHDGVINHSKIRRYKALFIIDNYGNVSWIQNIYISAPLTIWRFGPRLNIHSKYSTRLLCIFASVRLSVSVLKAPFSWHILHTFFAMMICRKSMTVIVDAKIWNEFYHSVNSRVSYYIYVLSVKADRKNIYHS